MNSVINTVMNPVMTPVTNSVLKTVTNRESHLLTTSGLVYLSLLGDININLLIGAGRVPLLTAVS